MITIRNEPDKICIKRSEFFIERLDKNGDVTVNIKPCLQYCDITYRQILTNKQPQF